MTQLSRRQCAIASLILAAGGGIVLACSSESTPSMTGAPLGPDQGTAPGTAAPPANGTGGETTSPGDVSNPPAGETNPGASAGEQTPGDLPIANPEMLPTTTPGTETPATETPPPGTGRQPNCAAAEGPVPALALTQVAANLNRPLFVTGVPGDDSRLMVVERGGTIRVILNGSMQEEPFLDVSAQLEDEGTTRGEHGLLGLAFHPDYANNGLFYVHFSAAGLQGGPAAGNGVIAEFKVSTDRSVADPASQRQILVVPDLEDNHNGGMITFGRDGMLYIGMGDGGGGDDQHGPIGNGQNLNELHGKLLRIDVAGRGVNDAYSIPAGNLAAQLGQNASPEIWAYGLRNPWRFSFDACNGDLYIGDVGQGATEEVDFLAADTLAGINFGWRVMEGPNCRPGGDANCVRTGLTLPVDSYGRQVGQSITGGYVYRGSNVPGLRGAYIYADYQSGRFFRFRIQGGQIADRLDITSQLSPGSARVTGITSFGQDNAGEVYVTSFTPGAVYRITAAAQ